MLRDDWCADTRLNERFPVYTRFNANDVLPDPITPLGASLAWQPHMLPAFSFGYATLGAITAEEASADPAAWPAGAFRYGHLYVNVTVARLVGIRSGLGWEAVDTSFFGNHPEAPPHEPSPGDLNEAAAATITARTQWTLTTSTYPDLDEETRIADGLRGSRPDLGAMTKGALLAYARSLVPYERITWRGEMIAGTQSAVGPAVIASVLPADSGLTPYDLVGPAGDVVSAAPAYALWDLSRVVRADPALGDFFDAGVEGMLPWLHDHFPAFHQQFLSFLREFGYRGPSEWDLGADSWETRPALPLALIDRMRHLDDAHSPAARRAIAAEAAEKAFAQAIGGLAGNAEAQATLRMATDSARRFAAWRELGKANCIKVLNESRVALRELGRRLVHEGALDDEAQVFMALDEELDLLVIDPALVTEAIREREIEWREYADLELPLFIDARVPRIPVNDLPRKAGDTFRAAVVGDVLEGVPAAAGRATGRARVIVDPADISSFEPGDVLVAPQTDPSWTPLFVVASAVVVGVGAANSHAMIVSRELGIPCVAGVSGATVRVPDGAMVTVDGSAGTVTIDESARERGT